MVRGGSVCGLVPHTVPWPLAKPTLPFSDACANGQGPSKGVQRLWTDADPDPATEPLGAVTG